MTDPRSTRFEMRAPVDWLREVDAWRREQPDLPPRAEAIRRLVDLGLGRSRTQNLGTDAAAALSDFTSKISGRKPGSAKE